MDMEMETEEEFLILEPFWVRDIEGDYGDVDVDIDYEFDAPKSYDFLRQETELEAKEAEFWFEIAPTYPPSPFVIESNWSPSFASIVPVVTSTDHQNYIGLESDNHIVQDIVKAGVKSPVKSPRLKYSFMNPTASQLAKKNCWPENHCTRLIRRFNKLSVENEERNARGSSIIGYQATKRQKLEAGYLRKVARLKHQALFQHKQPKKVDDNPYGRPKVTIPREPVLRTAYRAEWHRSRLNLESEENPKSDASSSFRARPLNRKILKSPSFPPPRKITPQQPDFQVFHLKTLQRARKLERTMQHSSISNPANVSSSNPISQKGTKDSRREKSNSTSKEKSEALDNSKPCCLHKKEPVSLTRQFPVTPPVESFCKLSLASVHSNAKLQTKLPFHNKGSKENAPGCLNLENEMMNTSVIKSQRLGGNRNQFGSDRRVQGIKPHTNI